MATPTANHQFTKHNFKNIIERMEDDLQSRAESEEKEIKSHIWNSSEELHSRTGLGGNQQRLAGKVVEPFEFDGTDNVMS